MRAYVHAPQKGLYLEVGQNPSKFPTVVDNILNIPTVKNCRYYVTGVDNILNIPTVKTCRYYVTGVKTSQAHSCCSTWTPDVILILMVIFDCMFLNS